MPDGRRGAGQPVIQADGRLLETHAGRAPSIKRRSLTPVPLGSMLTKMQTFQLSRRGLIEIAARYAVGWLMLSAAVQNRMIPAVGRGKV